MQLKGFRADSCKMVNMKQLRGDEMGTIERRMGEDTRWGGEERKERRQAREKRRREARKEGRNAGGLSGRRTLEEATTRADPIRQYV